MPELPSAENLVGSNWKLQRINDVPAIHSTQQELFFETDTTLSGFDGCNKFTGDWGSVPSEEGRDRKDKKRPMIWINYRSSTRILCRFTGEAGEQHFKFMSALRQEAISFSLSADEKELTLYHKLDGSNESLVFSRIPRPIEPHERLIGTEWVATGIVHFDSQNELRPVLEDNPVTLAFFEDSLKGTTGTNKYFGDVPKMTADDFQVANVGQTLRGWEEENDPRKVQEEAWISILNFGRAVDTTDVNIESQTPPEVVTLPYVLFEERVGDTDEWTTVLVLGSFRAPLARFVPLKHDDEEGVRDETTSQDTTIGKDEPLIEDLEHDTVQLAGSFWRATDINETFISDDPDSEFYADVYMFFTSETSVEGRGGCNQFHGSWEMLENDSQKDDFELISVQDLFGTYMLCNDEVMKIEDFLIRSLAKEPILYEVEAGELTLWTVVTDENGEKTRGEFIGRFFSDRVPSWGGKSLVGLTGEEASTIIKGVNPSLQVQIIPDGWMVTADYVFDRVRIFVGDDGNVTREPQRG